MPRGLRIGHTLTSYSTNFAVDENPISEGGKWEAGAASGYYGSPRTLGGKCFAGSTVTPGELDDNLAQLTSAAYSIPADCTVSATISKSTGSKTDSFEVGIYARRRRISGFYRGYEVLLGFNASEFQVVKWLGVATSFPANFEILSTSGIPAAISDGDVFTADFIGNVITVYRNGVLFNTTTDETDPWLDGYPGMGFFVSPGNDPSDYCISSWSVSPA